MPFGRSRLPEVLGVPLIVAYRTALHSRLSPPNFVARPRDPSKRRGNLDLVHHEQPSMPPSNNSSAPNFEPSASIFEIRRCRLLSRTRLAEIYPRANFCRIPTTFANGPSLCCGRGAWASALGRARAVEKAASEVVCRGGSTAPPSPTIGRGKGGAEEPPPARGSGVAAAGAEEAPWRLLLGGFVGKKKTRKSQRYFFEAARSARGPRNRCLSLQRRGFRPRRDHRWKALDLLNRFDLRYVQYERRGDTGAQFSELQWHFFEQNYEREGGRTEDISGTIPFQRPPRQSTDGPHPGEAIRPVGAGSGAIFGAPGPFLRPDVILFGTGRRRPGTISPEILHSRGRCDNPRTADAQETRSDAREPHPTPSDAARGPFPTVRRRPPAPPPPALSFAVAAGLGVRVGAREGRREGGQGGRLPRRFDGRCRRRRNFPPEGPPFPFWAHLGRPTWLAAKKAQKAR